MITVLQRYVAAVSSYVRQGSEYALLGIEEIGAAAIAQDMPLDELAGMHEAAMLDLAANDVPLGEATTIRRLSTCLATLTISSSLAYRARLHLVEWKRNEEHDRSERVRQRLEALGQMIGGVMHELNNVLQPITGFSEIMLADPAERSDPANMAILARCAKQAAHIVRNILSFVRDGNPTRAALPLGETVVAVMEFLKPILMLRQTLVLDIDDTMTPVLANEGELTQILINLLQNAANAKASRIRVEVVRTTHTFAGKAIVPRRRAVRFTVSDDGCGMTDEVARRAAEPFFTTRRDGEGTGLGLAIVKTIVEDWGGDLVLESSEREGTRIHAYLPVPSDDLRPSA